MMAKEKDKVTVSSHKCKLQFAEVRQNLNKIFNWYDSFCGNLTAFLFYKIWKEHISKGHCFLYTVSIIEKLVGTGCLDTLCIFQPNQFNRLQKSNGCMNYIFPIVMHCSIWYHLHYLKYFKNNYAEVLLLKKMDASVCHSTKTNTPPWVFFTFFEKL